MAAFLSARSGSMRRNAQYEEYLKSDHWKALRQAKFQEVGKACQTCPSTTKIIHVHHIRYRELTDCTTADLAVLCKDCHDLLHFAGQVFKCGTIDVELDGIKRMLSDIKFHKRYLRWKDRRECRKTKVWSPKKQKKVVVGEEVNGIYCRNRFQKEIANDPWFGENMALPRSQFLKASKAHFKPDRPKREWCRILCNACVLWERLHRGQMLIEPVARPKIYTPEMNRVVAMFDAD